MACYWCLLLCVITARADSAPHRDLDHSECSALTECPSDISLMQSSAKVQSLTWDAACVDEMVLQSLSPRLDDLNKGMLETLRSNQSSGSFLVDALCSGGVCDHDNDSIVLELPVIFPHLFSMQNLISLARSHKWLNVSMDDINHYITFTRFTRGIDKVSCDWCSLNNGVLELILHKFASIAPKDFRWVSKPIELYVQPDGQPLAWPNASQFDATPEQMTSFSWLPLYGKTKDHVANLISLRNTVEYIESRWCPFKHLTKIDFNRSYYAFSTTSKADLEQAAGILREKKRITGEDVTCDQCNKVVNEKFVGGSEPVEISFFDETPAGLSFMDRLRCAFDIECREADFPACARYE